MYKMIYAHRPLLGNQHGLVHKAIFYFSEPYQFAAPQLYRRGV